MHTWFSKFAVAMLITGAVTMSLKGLHHMLGWDPSSDLIPFFSGYACASTLAWLNEEYPSVKDEEAPVAELVNDDEAAVTKVD